MIKTSIDIPEWLHQQALDSCPDMKFGQLVRDALLIAIPEWRKLGPDRALELALVARLRMMQAEAAERGVELPDADAALKRYERRSRRPARQPAQPQASSRPDGPVSTPTAAGASRRPGRSGLPAQPSGRRQGPSGDSSADGAPGRGRAARTRRAAKTGAATAGQANPAS